MATTTLPAERRVTPLLRLRLSRWLQPVWLLFPLFLLLLSPCPSSPLMLPPRQRACWFLLLRCLCIRHPLRPKRRAVCTALCVDHRVPLLLLPLQPPVHALDRCRETVQDRSRRRGRIHRTRTLTSNKRPQVARLPPSRRKGRQTMHDDHESSNASNRNVSHVTPDSSTSNAACHDKQNRSSTIRHELFRLSFPSHCGSTKFFPTSSLSFV